MLKKNTLVILLILPLFIHAQEMWINEIHYDNTGGDVGEFVEVVVENTFNSNNLSNLEIIFYNGSNGSIISQSEPRLLSTFDVGQNSGGFTIYSRLFPSGIQNGNPDGIALVNNGTVVEFISYEGTLTATAGPANGMTSVDIGVAEPGAIGQSLQLSGSGNSVGLFTWQGPASATRGTRNNGQTFANVPPKIKSVFPASGTMGVNYTTPVIIEFTEAVNFSLSSYSVACGSNSQNVNFSLSTDSRTVTLTEVNYWTTNQTCNGTLFATNITDTDGANLQLDGDNNGSAGGDFTFSFTVAGDPPIPTVTSVVPADGTVLIPVNFSVDVNFNKNVTLSANAINLNCPTAVAFSTTGLSNVNMVTITPNASVAEGSFCTVTLNAINITDSTSQLDGDNDGIAGGNFSFTFAIIEPIYEIYAIQGSANASPLADSFVRTQGNVVTALTSSGYPVPAPSGFFMQTPEPGDSDTNTSDGIFVFSSSVVSVGDVVDVRGRVVEFKGLTELDMVSSVNITASGASMPTPITFDASTPSIDAANLTCVNNFECFEGMLVSVPNGMTNTGTGFFGEFTAAATGVRPMREPGIEFSKTSDTQLPTFPSATYNPDIFDENPELFEVDTNGLTGMSVVDLNGGSTFSATGVLTYQFGNFSLLPKQFSIITPRVFNPIRQPTAAEITVATQNMARFFDATDDPNINDFDEDTTTQAEYDGRVAQASLYFRTVMHSPDVIVLEEVENLDVVLAIAAKMNSDDSANTYSAYLADGNDIGGIDVGILSKDSVSNVVITQLGKAEVIQFGNTGRPLHDRPPLLLSATVTKGAVSREINVLGVHTRSRSGITGSQRQRIRNKHLEQALSIATMVQNLQSPLIPLVVTGDFNDFEFSDGYADVVGEIKGVVDPIKNLLSSNSNSVVNPTLVNVVDTLPATERYSFVFRGTIQTLDHALLNDAANTMLTEAQFVRGNIDAPAMFIGNYTQTLAMSDHDGLIIYLDLTAVLETVFLDGFE